MANGNYGDFGQFQGIDLSTLLGETPSQIAGLLGLSQAEGEKAGFYGIDPSILKALDPNNPEYKKRITGTQQSFMPSLMQGALNLGSGVAGGLGRGARNIGQRTQQMFQPYLSQLSSTMQGIGSDVGAARGMAGNYLSDIMGLFRGLDYEAPHTPVSDPITGLPYGEVPMHGDSPEITPGMYEDYIQDQMEGLEFNLNFSNVDMNLVCSYQGLQYNASTNSCE